MQNGYGFSNALRPASRHRLALQASNCNPRRLPASGLWFGRLRAFQPAYLHLVPDNKRVFAHEHHSGEIVNLSTATGFVRATMTSFLRTASAFGVQNLVCTDFAGIDTYHPDANTRQLLADGLNDAVRHKSCQSRAQNPSLPPASAATSADLEPKSVCSCSIPHAAQFHGHQLDIVPGRTADHTVFTGNWLTPVRRRVSIGRNFSGARLVDQYPIAAVQEETR